MPDLNSISPNSQGLPPVRGHRTSSSTTQNSQAQQTSSQPPAASTLSSLNILPSNQPAFQEASASYLPSPPLAAPPTTTSAIAHAPVSGRDETGPGPIRHPRPLTAAELHSQLEQEQELLVNRLSRDLTMLRMTQNSSVISNASSTSASTSAYDQLHSSSFTDTHLLSGSGFSIPTSRRHHRTSSNASTRSLSQAATQGSAPIPIHPPHSGNAASVLEAARNPRGSASMSRQNSTTSHRSSSRNRSPQPYMSGSGLLSTSHSAPHGFPQDYTSGYFARDRTSSNASNVATPGSELSPRLIPGTLRYEETAYYRSEFESAKRENETLKKRIKELEKMLQQRKESDLGQPRVGSESNSTSNTSVSMSGTTGVGGVVGGGTGIAGGRRDDRRAVDRTTSISGSNILVGVPDEELKVGESAATTAITQEPAQMESTGSK